MAAITLLCMGKLKERFYMDAAKEYLKRLAASGQSPFWNCRSAACRTIPPARRFWRG